MKKQFILWVLALLPLAACSLQEIAALNPNFLDPIHGVLFKNEYQVNDFQFLFDATNKTVAIKSRQSSSMVDGLYSLELIANPIASQGIYRLAGSKNYNNFFLGLEYSQTGGASVRAKIVIQESEIKVKDSLSTLQNNAYVNASLKSAAYYRAAASGTWARVSATGIYNAASTDHYTFLYNEQVDADIANQTHTLEVANISGDTAIRYKYRLTLVRDIDISSAIMLLSSEDASAPLADRLIGFSITNLAGGKVFAKIITSSSSAGDTDETAFINQLKSSVILDYTSLSSVSRPDLQLSPLRSKGPWVAVSGNVYNQLNTTNWDFSVQDQAVTITIYSPAGGGTPISRSYYYSLKTAGVSSVFQLSSTAAGAPFNNQYFAFKFRTYAGESVERASFYIEASESAAASRLSSPAYVDNYVNIYQATSLGGASTAYKLKIDAVLAASYEYLNKDGIRNALLGATVFTREDARGEYIYVVGGANNVTPLGANPSLYEITGAPTGLRNEIAVTGSFGDEVPGRASGWEAASFSVEGYPAGATMVAPFGGIYAWIGSRVFIYNPVKFSDLVPFDATLPSSATLMIPRTYRMISSSFDGRPWSMASLPSELTNRPHASFFASQGILVLAGGMHFVNGSHAGGTIPAGTYIVTNDIWQSHNGGATWSQVSKAAAFSPRIMATTLSIGADVFLIGGYANEDLTADPATSFSKEVWKSTDNGVTWVKAGDIPDALAQSYETRRRGRMPGFVINNVMYLVAGNTAVSIYSSGDGGKTWALEDQIDAIAGGGTDSRTTGQYGAGYVWSSNNPAHKGVLFSIGGYQEAGGVATLNDYSFRRVLR